MISAVDEKGASPTVSVLMAVHNGATYLAEAMESILCQSFTDFEFLIVDDASEDDSRQIMASNPDPRVRLLANPRKMGLAAALNRLWAEARGKYVARMDADDVSLPGRLAAQMEFLERNPDVLVCGTWVEAFGESSGVWRYPLRHEEIKCGLLFNSVLVHPTVMIRNDRGILGDAPYDETFGRSQDYELWSRLADKGRLANLGEVLLRYRTYPRDVQDPYRLEQREYADRVRERMLKNLGISPTPEQLELHARISPEQPGGRDFLQKAFAWLDSLLEANGRSGYFPSTAFEASLKDKIKRLCLVADESFGAWRLFMASPLARKGLFTLIENGVLTLNCIKRDMVRKAKGEQ